MFTPGTQKSDKPNGAEIVGKALSARGTGLPNDASPRAPRRYPVLEEERRS